jgi:excisionase family DNA binding protein
MSDLEIENLDEVLEEFEKTALLTKDVLLKDLKWKANAFESLKDFSDVMHHSTEFKSLFLNMINKLIEEVEHNKFFDKLEPWWSYSYKINESCATVSLCHYSCWYSLDDDGKYINKDLEIDTEYELIRVDARFLTVEEYARLYNVKVGTVRQWIRRGKLRTAKKYGNEWRISELSEVSSGRFRPAIYYIDEFFFVPDEYSFLGGYRSIGITKSKEDRGLFKVMLTGEKMESKAVYMTVKEREKFELFLISNPFIQYCPETYDDYEDWRRYDD